MVLFALAFCLLPLDSFPAGIAALREFGARPTNFVLLVVLAATVATIALHSGSVVMTRRHVVWLFLCLFMLPATNLLITLISTRTDTFTALEDWILQYLMLLWGLTSLVIWLRLLKNVPQEFLMGVFMGSAAISIFVFLLEYADTSGAIFDLLAPLRTKYNARPSGLASEPSLYAAWAVVTWPLLAYATSGSRSLAQRAAGCVLLGALALTAWTSNARTAAVIVVLQFIYLGYWLLLRRSSAGARVKAVVLLLLVGTALTLVLAEKLLSLTDLETNGSNIARFAYTLTGIRVAIEHAISGIGIGQFTHFFGDYVPNFALVNAEVVSYVVGTAEYRASTFNLFVRFAVEFGVPIAIVLSWLVIRPVLSAPARTGEHKLGLYAALSAVGGIGFWLSQDQYGYQPAIFSLALLLHVHRETSGIRDAQTT